VDKDGTQDSTAVVPASINGAGLNRAYNHRIRGVQSAFLMISLLTNKPIYLPGQKLRYTLPEKRAYRVLYF